MKLLIVIITAGLAISSCKVTEKEIAGVYRPGNNPRSHFQNHTRLILKEDKTFELAVLNPLTDLQPSGTGEWINYYTTGTWELVQKRLKLSPLPASQPKPGSIDDSITRFTNISCFNFWDRYGDPVSIRSIVVPPSHPKPHFGNSLYFFSQDFKPTDTLTFFFEGYPPFRFPGSVPSTIGNNMHKITLQEPYRSGIPDLQFIVRKNNLLLLPNKLRFGKKE